MADFGYQSYCEIERNTDYAGSDIGVELDVESAEICAFICGERMGCLSFTYEKENEKCWMKSAVKPNRQSNEGGDSGLPCSPLLVDHGIHRFRIDAGEAPGLHWVEVTESARTHSHHSVSRSRCSN